jgi:hypothetical protein
MIARRAETAAAKTERNPMNPEQIGTLLKALIADHDTLGGTEPAENVSGRPPDFHEWVLRHVLTHMLLRSEQFAAADFRRVPDPVVVLALPEYTEWTDAGAVHIRMRLIARTGETSEFRVYATLSRGRRGVSISTEWPAGPSAVRSLPAEQSTTRHVRHTPVYRAPVLGNGIVHHYP